MKTLNNIPLTLELATRIAKLPTPVDRASKARETQYAMDMLNGRWDDDPTGFSFTGPSIDDLQVRLNGGNRSRARIVAERMAKAEGRSCPDPSVTLHFNVKPSAFEVMDTAWTKSLAMRSSLTKDQSAVLKLLRNLEEGRERRISAREAIDAFGAIGGEVVEALRAAPKVPAGAPIWAAAVMALSQDSGGRGRILSDLSAFAHRRYTEFSSATAALARVLEKKKERPELFAAAHRAFLNPELERLAFKDGDEVWSYIKDKVRPEIRRRLCVVR